VCKLGQASPIMHPVTTSVTLPAVTGKGVGVVIDGRWTMDDGRWTMDDGRWTMDDGRWTMDDGRWTMDDGRWTMEQQARKGEGKNEKKTDFW
jgi:hypothetical protein